MKILNNHEYDKLVSGIMVYPCNIIASSNSTSAGPIDKQIVSKQYNTLFNTLLDYGVRIHFFDLNRSTSQVFARDIGFIIDNILFISNMTQPERQTEIKGLIDFAKQHNIKSHIMENKVEGGDILVHNSKVFVGVGYRTNEAAVQEIDHILSLNNKQYEFIKVSFNTSKIHLDCVLNIVSNETCIISTDVFNPQDVLKHFSTAIEVPIKEQDSLATNIIDLGNNVILCSSNVFSKILQDHGYNSIFIDFSEIIKASGSLGCCLMPLLRVPRNVSGDE